MGGYTFLKFAGIEGSYRDLGSIGEAVGATSVDFDATSLDVFGVGFLPLGEKFELFAKAGFSQIDFDVTINDPLFGTISASEDDEELAYGAGFNYTIGGRIAIRVEYETFDTDEDLSMASAGAVLKF